jgi:hypothetical protein
MQRRKSRKENEVSGSLPELRIYGVANIIYDQISNIAANSGVGMSALLKPHLRKIIDSYPEHMRRTPPID